MFDFNEVAQLVFAVGRVGPTGVTLTGTAFALPKNGLFATAYHTVGVDDTGLVLVTKGLKRTDEYQDTSDPQVRMFPVKIYNADPMHDLVTLSATTSGSPNVVIGGADDAPVGTAIASFGFPHADHGRMVVTRQNAEIGARVLIDSGGVRAKHLVLNTQARPGQSGSPVFREGDGRLVGILVGSYAPGGGGSISLGGVDPHTLHQTTHAVSAEYLEGMY